MQSSQTQNVRLFWQPGCSSCVKIKEMLTNNAVKFESINVLENVAGLEELQRRGIKTLPLVFRGDEMVFGQSLDDVAKFVGIRRPSSRLPSSLLRDKWSYVLETSLVIIERMPDKRLDEPAFAERPRKVGELSYHVFQMPEAFIAVMDDGLEDTRPIVNGIYPHLHTKDEILGYARGIRTGLARWFADNPALGEGRTVKTYWGMQPASQVLERFTWHSAQHMRQLDFVLSTETNAPSCVDPTVYEGLPMPTGLWD